jgi:hypothetical protein
MRLTIPNTRRAPVLPLLAFFMVGYLNVINRCADGYCYTHGWPWVAYYGWSDAGFNLKGTPIAPRVAWWPVLGNTLIAGLILLLAFCAHRHWRRKPVDGRVSK